MQKMKQRRTVASKTSTEESLSIVHPPEWHLLVAHEMDIALNKMMMPALITSVSTWNLHREEISVRSQVNQIGVIQRCHVIMTTEINAK